MTQCKRFKRVITKTLLGFCIEAIQGITLSMRVVKHVPGGNQMNKKMVIPIVLATVIIVMLIVSTTPKNATPKSSLQPSNCGTLKKWNPGHYLLPTKDRTIEEIEAILSDPDNHITGVKMGYWWRELEPEKDGYDFSEIETHLALVKKYDTI